MQWGWVQLAVTRGRPVLLPAGSPVDPWPSERVVDVLVETAVEVAQGRHGEAAVAVGLEVHERAALARSLAELEDTGAVGGVDDLDARAGDVAPGVVGGTAGLVVRVDVGERHHAAHLVHANQVEAHDLEATTAGVLVEVGERRAAVAAEATRRVRGTAECLQAARVAVDVFPQNREVDVSVAEEESKLDDPGVPLGEIDTLALYQTSCHFDLLRLSDIAVGCGVQPLRVDTT